MPPPIYKMSCREEDTWKDYLWYWWHHKVTLRIPLWLRQPRRWWKNRKRVKAFPPGTIVEDCRYHPVIILTNDNGDLWCWDMCEGGVGSCSLFHCGIGKLEPTYAYETAKKWKSGELNNSNFYPDYVDSHEDRYMD